MDFEAGELGKWDMRKDHSGAVRFSLLEDLGTSEILRGSSFEYSDALGHFPRDILGLSLN